MATATSSEQLQVPELVKTAAERPRVLWTLPLILAAAIAPYLPSLRFSFAYDDKVQVLAISAIRSWSSVPAYFYKPIPEVAVRYYRPIFFLWFRLNYFLWNTHAWGWHLTNIALHALVSVLVFQVLGMYFKDRRCAVVGALLFAAYPAHIETVAWVSGCTDSLMAIGLLGSVLLWGTDREGPTFARRIGSLLCGIMALGSKETAIILPALIGVHAFAGIPATCGEPNAIGERLRFAVRQAAPYAVTSAAYLAFRSWVLRGIAGTPNWISHTQSLLTIPSLLLFYVRHLFWPMKLSIFYDFTIVDHVNSYLFWLPLLALAAIATGAWFWYRSAPDVRIALAAAWILVPVAPVLYIRKFQPDEFAHDRYLYLPVLGVSILAGILCEILWGREPEQKASPFSAAIAGFAVLCLGLATAVQAEPWKNDLTLYTHAVQVAPKNIMARNNLSSEYADEGRYQEAREVLKALLVDRPDMWLANYNFGYVNYRLGNLAVAEEYLGKAIRIKADDPDQYLYLGATYFKQGRLTEAATEVQHAIALRPNASGYHFMLGLIELQQGDTAPAREEMQKELKYHPENASRVQQARPMFQHLPRLTQ